MSMKVLMLPGDGIGPEVMHEAEALLEEIAAQHSLDLQLDTALIGGAAMDATGAPLPEETLQACREADAVLLGAVGGPKWSDPNARVRPEQGLLELRKALGLFVNLRPIRVHPSLAPISPLRPEFVADVDVMVVRELTGGIYFGEKQEGDDHAVDVCSYTREEIERVVVQAAELARQRCGGLTLVDKANVLATSRLWRKVTTELMTNRYPDVPFETMLVDAASMHIVANPSRFNVLVTENLFGDILTDEASMLVGSMGMLPSASLGKDRAGLYEPIHGSAPDIAGQGIANPVGMLASVGMMFRYSLGIREVAGRIERAIWSAIADGQCTPDIGGSLTTRAAGEAVRERLGEYYIPKFAYG
ncbi:MAG: 3-isopropylmalate dehydrogenase [Xanthomonadales bacterium]|nr:3-isopropylmalate dehydrogenase [Xanthomonadales bacterium]NIN59086.1 3-isopropylmalate dehydrogenase [Xanthomonadales bacterium]NIN74397.1 3-isopropylmalate dehydrogenase [Xanthomonadales bacterium]NIO13197.1 3-isopropylmalate dehydrogenase [Xanthomonadales bacterium]NIP11479.1 3-isopropylmalate dehydrogenase [Xanthomonadales bacterium]